VVCIGGGAGNPGQEIQAFQESRATLRPEFEVDEIARLFSTEGRTILVRKVQQLIGC
jgi:hypothetical protein